MMDTKICIGPTNPDKHTDGTDYITSSTDTEGKYTANSLWDDGGHHYQKEEYYLVCFY